MHSEFDGPEHVVQVLSHLEHYVSFFQYPAEQLLTLI